MPLIQSVVIFTALVAVVAALLCWSAWSSRKKTKAISLTEAVDRLKQHEKLMMRHLFHVNPDPKQKKNQRSSNVSSGGKSNVHLRS